MTLSWGTANDELEVVIEGRRFTPTSLAVALIKCCGGYLNGFYSQGYYRLPVVDVIGHIELVVSARKDGE